MSDLPSQYAEEIETFRQILDLPDPRGTMPRSSTPVLGLDDEKGQQELRPRGSSAMLPLSPFIKEAFEKFEEDFLASKLPEGKYLKPPASTVNTIRWDSLALKTNFKSLTQILPKSVFRPNPLVLLLPRFPLISLRSLSNSLDKISPLSISLLLLIGLLRHATLFWKRAFTVPGLHTGGPKTKSLMQLILGSSSNMVMTMHVNTLI